MDVTTVAADAGATISGSPGLEPALGGKQAGGVLRVENLSAFYDRRRAVRDVTLDFRPNLITAIIGPSGSGKSTLLRCMNRMHEVVPRGRVETRIVDVHPAAVRR